MRVKINIDKLSDIAEFVLVSNDIPDKVFLTNEARTLIVDGKSFLGVAHAAEFDDLWCECESDIYSKIEKFVVS